MFPCRIVRLLTAGALLVIRIPAKDYSGVQRGGLQIHKEIDVPNDGAFLRTGIYDLKSNNAGMLGVPLSGGVTAAK